MTLLCDVERGFDCDCIMSISFSYGLLSIFFVCAIFLFALVACCCWKMLSVNGFLMDFVFVCRLLLKGLGVLKRFMFKT